MMTRLIKQGKNVVINISFPSLMRAYPYYLKLGIMACRENFIKKDTSGGDS
jgi:branched-subunit amino acid permease